MNLKEFLQTMNMPCKGRIFYNETHYDFDKDALQGVAELIGSDYKVIKWNVQDITYGKNENQNTLFIYVEKQDKPVYQWPEGVRGL